MTEKLLGVSVGDFLPSIMGAIVSAIAFPHPPKHYSEDTLRSRQDLKFLKTKTGLRIPCVHITKCGAKFTIIYSHGNAEDVGLSLNYLDIMSDTLDASVIAYEYPGMEVDLLVVVSGFAYIFTETLV